MTAALEGGEWLTVRPGRTLPPGKTRYPFYGPSVEHDFANRCYHDDDGDVDYYYYYYYYYYMKIISTVV